MFTEIKNQWNLPMYRMHYSVLPELIDRLNKDYTAVAFDIETTGLNLVKDSILGFGLCFEHEKAYYVDLTREPEWVVAEVFKQLQRLKIKIVIHNSLFDICFVGVRYKVDLTRLDIVDTLIMEHTTNTHKQYYKISMGLKALAMEYTRFGDYEALLEDWKNGYIKSNKIKKDEFSYDMIPVEILEPYCCMDVIVTFQVLQALGYQIKKHVAGGWDQLPKLIRIKHEANKHYLRARINGIMIDRERLEDIGQEWLKERDRILKELHALPEVKLAEKLVQRRALTKEQSKLKNKMKLSKCRKLWKENTFKFTSNAHKQTLFFEVIGLAPKGKTKSGANSVDGDFVEAYAHTNRVCEILGGFSKLEKGITSFYDNIMAQTSDEYPIVHPDLNLCGTVSSRTSCKEPNISQVPSRKPLNIIKDAFVVEDGYNWIAFDYCAQEYRVMAHLSGEDSILEAIKNDYDLHSTTALRAFGDKMTIPEGLSHKETLDYIKEHYGKTWRDRSKTLVFSLLYGVTAYGLKDLLKCSAKEAQSSIDSYFAGHPKVKAYIDSVKDFIHQHGYVENRAGARVYLQNAKQYDWRKMDKYPKGSTGIKGAKEEYKFAVNFTIQSACSFILYESIVPFFDEIENLGLDVTLITTIYDSVMLKVHKSIDPNLIADLLRKHFTTDLGNVIIDIDAFMSPSGCWGSYEEISLNK